MKHISINVSKEIKNILPKTLEKDLQDDEEICPVCHGLGVVIDNNIYGIKGDTSEAAKGSMFPYNHQAIKFCPNCFNGVISLCQYCGKQIQKGSIESCDCEQYKAKEEEVKRIKYQEKISKAEEVDFKDIDSDMWFYDEYMDDFFSDVDSFVDAYKDFDEYASDEEMMNNLPEVLWLTDPVDISMDADDIIASACEDLHEDAYENISSEDTKELQNMLDEWCEKQTGTRTVYPNYKKYVKVRKEWFE